jgi:parallel beta-helix repeat protein
MRATTAANARRLRVLLGLGVLASALLSVSPATPAVSSEFIPEADSYVSALHENTVHGDLSYLRADDVPRRTMYLRFNVSGIRAGSSVALRLWIEKKTRTGLQVRGVSNDWDESTITFKNAPAPGPVAAESGPLPRESWISIDVTSLVSSDGPVSLALTTTNENSINVPSREAAPSLRPRLVVTSPDIPLSPFTVTPAGTLYQASSPAGVMYTGTLKTVVESAAGDLARVGGGTVRFAPGTFDLGRDALEFQGLSNVQFEGAGIDATNIRNSSIASVDTEIFDLARTSGIVIRGLTLAASGSPRTTSDAIDVDGGSDTLVENVRITASRGRGIVFDGKDAFEGAPLEAARNVVRDCVITGVPGDGIQLLAAADGRVERCAITNAGRHGISVVKASTIASQPNKKSHDNVLAANVIRDSGHDGINITSSDGNQLLGNIIVNSSSTVTGGDGIRLSAADGVSCDANVIQGNAANDTRVVKRQRFGLNVSDPLCARTDVRENDFSSNLRGPIQDLGTDTIFSVSVDLEAPTVPTTLAVAADASRVDVTWSEATDNVGVTGYTVYRDGVPVGTVGFGTLSFSDTTVVGSTTYSYAVDAFDAVGNHSDPSAAVSVTTPAGATVSTFDAVADTYVNADTPATNFGSGDELRTDNAPLIRSFLRFDVSGITGTVTRAKLRIFANSSSSAGFEVHALSATFDETAVTHETAPEVGTMFGTSPAFTAGGYIEVDITSAISGDGIFEFALTALGDTATSFGSRESANKPQLVIESAD